MNDGTQQEPGGLPAEENDPLWQMLGRAPMPEPGPWFTVRALARCHTEARKNQLTIGAVLRWALGGGLGVGVVVLFVMMQLHMQVQTAQTQTADKQKTGQEAVEIMASIDTTDNSSSNSSSTDTTSPSPWQDSSL